MTTDPDKGYQLPEEVYPVDSWCYQIMVPQDISYLRALRGAIGTLTYNWNWQRDEAHTAALVVQVWQERILAAEELLALGECGVIDCEQIASCITNESVVQNAIISLNNSSTGYNTPDDNPLLATTGLIDSPGCDLDEMWGNAVALWSAINQLSIDLLEIIAQAGNLAEVAANATSAIPLINQLPVDEGLAMVGKLADWALENYNAGLTVLLEQEIICDIFCIMTENCTLTFEQLTDYFYGYFAVDLNSFQVANMIAWITGTGITGTPLIYAITSLQLFVVSTAQKFVNVDSPNFYALQSQLGEPDNDWSILCDECDSFWEHTIDLTASNGGFTTTSHGQISGTGGVWTNGVGWQASNTAYAGNVGRRELIIVKDWTEANIKEITYTYSLTKGTWANPAEDQFNLVAATLPNVARTNASLSNGAGQTIVHADPEGDYVPVDGQSIRMLSSLQSPTAYSGALTLTSVTYKGFGFNPFV